MKAILLDRPGSIKITELKTPFRSVGEVLVKVKAAGICGSDIGAYRGTNPLVSYPRIIGHEIAGEVLEVDNDSEGLNIGDHVVIDPYLYCGYCYPCTLGRTNCCENLKVLGVHTDGGMQDIIVHPVKMLLKVPDNIPWHEAVLAEPITIALHALHRIRLKTGEHILVCGAGTIGLLTALCAKAFGAEPIVTDLVEERLVLARNLGISHTINLKNEDAMDIIKRITKNRLVEAVVEASGSNESIRSTLDLVAFSGRIALTGWPKAETLLPTDIITRKELDFLGSRNSAGEFTQALRLLAQGTINVNGLISKTIHFNEIPSYVEVQSKFPEKYTKIVAIAND